MKKRGGDIAVIIFLLIGVVLIVLFEFFYVYTAVLGHDLKISKITGWFTEGGGGSETLITIYPEQEIGKVREDFYGANTGGRFLAGDGLTYGTKIAFTNGTSTNTYINVNEHQEVWLNSGMTLDRADMGLNSYYKNTTDATGVNFSGDLTQQIESLKWKHEHGIKTLYIADYMPDWLADNSSGTCGSLYFCPPSNYTIWGNIVVDFLNRVTEGNTTLQEDILVEVWNEPDSNYFMSLNNIENKALNYTLLFNETYNAIKSKYPTMEVGGPALTTINSYKFMTNFFNNFYNQIDFFDFHHYGFGSLDNYFDTAIDTILANFTEYSVNCTRILVGEWNENSDELKNTSSRFDEYGMKISKGYQYLLNNYPENISSIMYQFAERENYSSGDLWQMFTGSQLYSPTGRFSASYNVTKDFAHYHVGGNMIVNSSSSNESIRVVASLNPESIWHITTIMIDGGESNLSIDVGSSGIEALMDLKTDEIYNVVNGTVDVGVIEQYDVKHYESTAPVEKIIEEEIELSEEEILIEGDTIDEGGETNILDEVVQDNETETINETMEITTKTSKKRNVFKTIFLWDAGDSTNLDLIEEGVTENNLPESENKTESLGEIIIDYITGASSTDDNYSNDKKHSSSSSSSSEETLEEGEALLTEGIESEVSESTNTTYTLSQALSNKGYMSIIIILLVGIIVVGLIIKGIYKKKKHNADMVIKLNDWVKRAKALGYNYTKMKTLLEEKRWNSGLIEKALYQNGVQREPLY